MNRQEVVQDSLADVLERLDGLDCFDKAAMLRRVAHKCFQAAKVLEGQEKGSPT